MNSATAFQHCTSLAKETRSLTHSEDEDGEAAFHRHYGYDSELGTKCPLSNSLEIFKKAQSYKYSQSNVSSHSPHTHTPAHKRIHTMWARQSCRNRNAVQLLIRKCQYYHTQPQIPLAWAHMHAHHHLHEIQLAFSARGFCHIQIKCCSTPVQKTILITAILIVMKFLRSP